MEQFKDHPALNVFKKAAEKSGKPLDEFMKTEGIEMRDKFLQNKKVIKTYDRWLRGNI